MTREIRGTKRKKKKKKTRTKKRNKERRHKRVLKFSVGRKHESEELGKEAT